MNWGGMGKHLAMESVISVVNCFMGLNVLGKNEQRDGVTDASKIQYPLSSSYKYARYLFLNTSPMLNS